MSGSAHHDTALLDDAVTAAFADALARAGNGSPTLLLLAGAARDVRTTLATTVADAPLARGTRVVDVEPDENAEFDPIAAAAHVWRKGARRVAFNAQQRDVAWGWIGMVPLGNLIAAIGETVAVVNSRRAGRDSDLARLLRAARQRPLIVVVHDLHRAGRNGALRLCAAIDAAPAGTRLLIVAGADPAIRERGSPAIFDAVRSLPPERAQVVRVTRDHGAVDRLRDISADAAAAVQAASVLGRSFDSATLARALAIDELLLEDRLAVAVRAGLLRVTGTIDLPDGDVASAYAFDPPALRDTIYDALPAALRDSLEARVE
jgi:hypothetical protein